MPGPVSIDLHFCYDIYDGFIDGIEIENSDITKDHVDNDIQFADLDSDGIDEIIYVDTVANLYNRSKIVDIVYEASRNIGIPLTAGGGVRTLKDIEEKYRELYHAGNTYMIISGDVVFEEVVALVELYFSQWQPKKLSYSELNDPINAPTTTLHFVEMPNAVQTEIALLNLASLSRQNPDYFPIMVANQVLGGGGEARLFLNLREDKGYTYGAYSSFRTEHKTKSIFRAGSSVRNEVADSACLLYTSPSPRDLSPSRMPSSA